MVLRSFVKINLLFRIMDPLKRKSPLNIHNNTNNNPYLLLWLIEKKKDLCHQVLTNVKVSFSVRSTGASMSFS